MKSHGDGDKANYQNARFYSTRHDLPDDARIQVVELLNQTLATTIDLRSQFKQAHWNVKGMNFYSLYQLFDQIAAQLDMYIDRIAERITALGSTALGTVRAAVQYSELPDYDLEASQGKDHVRALADRLAPYARLVRTAIDEAAELTDTGTADLYAEISRAIDKYLWLLESHLQKS